jgi:DNA polymerase-3 subunit beta
MKITIERGLLLKVLSHIQGVVERRNTIPILSNVRFDASGGQLSLNATDLDIDIVETVAVEVLNPGTFTAPAHTLYDIVRKLTEGSQVELDCTGDDSQLTLSASRSKFKLSCLPTEDFPVISAGELANNFSLTANDLRGLIDRTRFAISTEETRYYLNGIYLHVIESDGVSLLRAVATDGHRLASVDLPMPDGAKSMPGVIIPRKAVLEIRKLIDEIEDKVVIGLSDTKIKFSFGGTVLTSKLIDGTFPDYDRVIPQGNDKVLEVETQLFAQAVDRVSAISTEKSRAVKLNISKGNLLLSANSADNDTANEALQVDYDEAEIEIGFNSRYLLDIAQQIGGDRVRFTLADSASPTLVQDLDDKGAIYVLMPMRV